MYMKEAHWTRHKKATEPERRDFSHLHRSVNVYVGKVMFIQIKQII